MEGRPSAEAVQRILAKIERLPPSLQECATSGRQYLHRLPPGEASDGSSPRPDGERKCNSGIRQYRALPGVRGKGIASRTLARPVT